MKNPFGPRARALALILLVAVLGALIGIGVDRALAGPAPETRVEADAPDHMHEWRVRGMMRRARAPIGPTARSATMGARFLEQLEQELGLSAEQRAAIERILQEDQERVRELMREYQPRFRAIARETREKIAEVLTEEQLERRRSLAPNRGRHRSPDDEAKGWEARRDAMRQDTMR